MNLQQEITAGIQEAVRQLFKTTLDSVEIQETRKEFEGDLTVVIFPMLRTLKGNPVQIGEQLGEFVTDKLDVVTGYNVVKGFLNLIISDQYYIHFFKESKDHKTFGFQNPKVGEKAVMVEYSSPNTNKPLHLGHVRNVLLGYSVAEILKASGKKVYKTQIINDRGIHICKSMVSWWRENEAKKKENQDTPENSDKKGDHLVGEYYVKFDKEYKNEIRELEKKGFSKEEAEKQASIFKEAQEMLIKWEAGDPDVLALWKQMNGWVYDGFEKTYKSIGVDFDSYYYESNTYLLGKDIIEEGLSKKVFYSKDDGSVWCDLTADGLDEKLVLRSDGTAVYMTQDIGTAVQRVKDYPDVGGMIYTVGNEQDYHFKVLFAILKKLGYDWANNLHHLSYGMVDLPEGKMKSREGTVVDADDLIASMQQTAAEISSELGKLDGYSKEEKTDIYNKIGLGALKYFILKVDPKKRILFDPKKSVDFQGNTGPFIQYTYARIQAIVRKGTEDGYIDKEIAITSLQSKEKELLKIVSQFPETIQQAAKDLSPALIANYTYDLVKSYNSFFQNVSIFGADTQEKIIFRVQLSKFVGQMIETAFSLLGIQVPERM